MKCQILFSGKNKKNISKCRLLKILPRVLSVNFFIQVLYRYALNKTCHVSHSNHLKSFFCINPYHDENSFSRRQIGDIFFLIFPRKQDLTRKETGSEVSGPIF